MDRRLPTLSDVARCAGVSYATADRVVNARAGVSERTTARVRSAIEQLGYVRNVAAANLSQGRVYEFLILLPGGDNAFFQRIGELFAAARRLAARDHVDLRIETLAAFDPKALASRLARIAQGEIDGVALVGSDDAVVAAAIDRLKGLGIAVLTLVSDVPQTCRDGYVGIDNRIAGRTAARLISLSHGGKSGRVLPVLGAVSAMDHAERLDGLAEILPPSIELLPRIEGFDRDEIVEAKVREVFAGDAAISAIYSAGAGNAGLIRFLRESGQGPGARRPVVVLHELVPHSRQALEDGIIDIVIDQRPVEIVNAVLQNLRQIADRRGPVATGPIVPAIYVAENLPPDVPETRKDQSS